MKDQYRRPEDNESTTFIELNRDRLKDNPAFTYKEQDGEYQLYVADPKKSSTGKHTLYVGATLFLVDSEYTEMNEKKETRYWDVVVIAPGCPIKIIERTTPYQMCRRGFLWHELGSAQGYKVAEGAEKAIVACLKMQASLGWADNKQTYAFSGKVPAQPKFVLEDGTTIAPSSGPATEKEKRAMVFVREILFGLISKSRAIIMVIYNILSLFTSSLEECGHPRPHMLLYVFGPTGIYKTTISKFIFGSQGSEFQAPFKSTPPATEALLSAARDCVCIIDDLVTPLKGNQGAGRRP